MTKQIQYKKLYSQEYEGWITEQEALYKGNYEKVFFDVNNLVLKKELYADNVLKKLYFYSLSKETYTEHIEQYQQPNLLSISFIELENHGEFIFKQAFDYSIKSEFIGTNQGLYDRHKKLIAKGWKNEHDQYEYDSCKKYYYDPAINPDDEVFNCWFNDDGELMELYWSNRHIDPSEQESFVLFNTPEDIETLMRLTGMSQELAEYYMVPEIEPSFKSS